MNHTDLLITDVEIVGGDETRRGHVVIEGGSITAVLGLDEALPDAGESIDGGGRLAIPGGVDGHCHIAQHTAGWDTVDSYGTATTAALWGGTTTVLDFGIPRDDGESPLEAARRKRRLAAEARCDVGLHGSVVHWDDTVPAQLDELWDMGIRSVKMYATNRGTTMADPDTIIQVMHEVADRGGLVYLHAEHDAMTVDCTARHAGVGEIGIEHLHQTRPEIVEEASVRELLAMAEYTGVATYFVHQTTPGAVALVAEARQRGQHTYSETCGHYLVLDDSIYSGDVPECFACCPPMRERKTVDALAQVVGGGAVDVLSSDHSCYDLAQKRQHRDDVRRMPHGLPGVEVRLPVTWTRLVEELGMSPASFVDLFAAAPARINGLAKKGRIAPGADADLVVFDPRERRTVRQDELHMGTDFTPFEGHELSGWPQVVVSAGRAVLADNQFKDPGPVGRYLPRLDPMRRWDTVPGEPISPVSCGVDDSVIDR